VALLGPCEAKEAKKILADEHLGVNGDVAADGTQRIEGARRSLDQIANAPDVDYGMACAAAVEPSGEFRDHFTGLTRGERKGNKIPFGAQGIERQDRGRWLPCQIATASASAASAPATVAPGSRTRSIACTCSFAAPPVPTIAFLTRRGAYSTTGRPARAQASSATPRACASLSVDCGLSLTNISSTAAHTGSWSAITAARTVSRCARRSGRAALASVLTWPLAIWLIRLPS